MSLDKEAHALNERQKRYREHEWEHKHMAGADHREMMAVLEGMAKSIERFMAAVLQRMDASKHEQRLPYYRGPSYRGSYDRPPSYQYDPTSERWEFYEHPPRPYDERWSKRPDDPHL